MPVFLLLRLRGRLLGRLLRHGEYPRADDHDADHDLPAAGAVHLVRPPALRDDGVHRLDLYRVLDRGRHSFYRNVPAAQQETLKPSTGGKTSPRDEPFTIPLLYPVVPMTPPSIAT